MKTLLTLQSAAKKKNGVAVEYALQDDKGTANVKTVIPEESLLTYITENSLHAYVIDVVDGGVDFDDPQTYIYDNLRDVVLRYLTENLK